MMNEQSKSRLPLIATIVAVSLLGLGGGYFYMQRGNRDGPPQISAAKAADKELALAGVSDADRKKTEAIVRAYLLEHPEILQEAAQVLQQREIVQRLTAAGANLTKPFAGAVSGNPQGDVTLVEFTDYSCGFCKASVADVKKLAASDKGVKIVYREVAILTPASKVAAQWALAAAKQGKHAAFHDAMFAGERPDDQSIRAAARVAGLDMTRAEKDAVSAEVAAEIESNLAIMRQVGFSGTPTFVIGDQILEGALGHDALKEAVAKARKKA
jgi:protein-disulfide isomerase